MGILRKYLFGLLLSLAFVIVGVAGLLLTKPYTFQGTLIDSPQPAPEFTLNDQHNQPFDLGAQKGNIVLMFFGYTHCPDVCPATLANFKELSDRLGSQVKDVRFVFITVDPQRDTATVMQEFLAKFNPAFVGLVGSQPNLAPVWKSYGVFVQAQPVTGSDNYLETHSDLIYLIDRQGRLRLTYSNDTPVENLLQDVQYLLRNN